MRIQRSTVGQADSVPGWNRRAVAPKTCRRSRSTEEGKLRGALKQMEKRGMPAPHAALPPLTVRQFVPR